MLARKIFNFMLLCFGIAALASCSESEDQRDFREQALSGPSGIMAMTVNGTPVEDGENDMDDWRTAPAFQGSITIATPAFPNPVSFNSTFEILVDVRTFQSVNGLQVFAFQQSGQMIGPLFQQSGTLNTGFTTIRISPQEFASSAGTGNFGDLYRLIFYDSRGDVITYGDIQVQ